MACTRTSHIPKWESAELRQLKQKLAKVKCRCPVCEKSRLKDYLQIYDDLSLEVQTERLNVADNSCQCNDSKTCLDIAQSSDTCYGFDTCNAYMGNMQQPFLYPYGPCPSCILMSNLLLGRATNFKDEEIEVNIKVNGKDKCNCACIMTTEQSTAVSQISTSFATECKLLTTYECDADAEESDVYDMNKEVNITTSDLNANWPSKVNESHIGKKRTLSKTSSDQCSDSTDLDGKLNAKCEETLKKKRHSGLKIKKKSSTAFRSRINTTNEDNKKRVRITKRRDFHSDSTECFDPKYNSMDEDIFSKQQAPPSSKKKARNLSAPIKNIRPRKKDKLEDDAFLRKTPVPDTKCANLESFINQIRQPLPTFSEVDLISSYSDVTFSMVTL